MIMRGPEGFRKSQPKNDMKSTKLIILGALLGVTAIAGAQDKPKKEGGRGVPPEILEKFDADKDGKLNKEEREAAKAAREKEFDKDGDGKLSDEEKAAIPKGPRGDKGPKGDKKPEGQ